MRINSVARFAAATLVAIGALGASSSLSAKGPFSHLYDKDANGVIPEKERRALLDLYAATEGEASWDNHDGWNGPPGSECHWHGITCNHTHVILIELGDNHLKGVLPDLSALTELDYLDVRGNQLHGSIVVLGKVTSLRGVNVSDNAFEGELPPLGELHGLLAFFAYRTQLSGSIPPLAGLDKLENLSLANNRLSGAIPALRGLTALQSIDLSDNQLSGEIPTFEGLDALQSIELSNNHLRGPIPELTGLSKLHGIKISGNQLAGAAPAVPSPNEMVRGGSRLCPNLLASSNNPVWDRATNAEPWYQQCLPTPLQIGR